MGKRLDKNAIKCIVSAFGWLELRVITSKTRQNISVFFVIKKNDEYFSKRQIASILKTVHFMRNLSS